MSPGVPYAPTNRARMRNIKLTIQYDGTNYSGWQFQKNARSIQAVIEERIRRITGKKSTLTASGRTDAGVHAAGQVANFKTNSQIPLKNLQKALNASLPKEIVISRIEEVELRFDSQRHAKSKLYRYTVYNSEFVDPFIRRFASKCFYRLDVRRMRIAAGPLLGRPDFTAFRAKDSREGTAVRAIKKIKIEKESVLLYIYIEANGFLYNMARNIVGTLIEVGRGKMEPEYVKIALLKKDRSRSGPTAPAKGLCLL